ncbi:General transcription factor II-I repeat domain-containing protein 2B [Holothuria leucospilota]|uniref:General transcription factor II-I repeat domain-containing protein 2B n=1 Tax=Holothuria leucospilota TaxID=206669 RepID=A0A9Q1HF82_HOLLE|nr:General transcription factor II-I repeat domain-containing protein 2B [Holothuria leucospilota]
MESEQETLLYHTEVRWLSRGNVLTRLFVLLKEIQEFFESDRKQKSKDYLEVISHDEWEPHLANLVGIFQRINALNQSLQGRQATIIDVMDKLRALLLKINLRIDHINDGNFAMFEELCQLARATSANLKSIATLAI